MESLFDQVRNNLKKGMKEGIAVLKEGANVVSVKMNELSAEGKRQYKIFNLNLKIQDQINELGGMTYAILESGKSLDENKKIKAAFAKIKKLKWQLIKIGGKKIKTAAPKKPAKKTAKKVSTKKVNVQS